jgi:hypothetical protein
MGSRWTPVVAAVLVGALAVGTGAALHTASARGGSVTLEVPGAMNLAVYCGGEETHFADGTSITFTPAGDDCDIEAPLSAAMPLRSRVQLEGAGTYRCDRVAMDLVCERQ